MSGIRGYRQRPPAFARRRNPAITLAWLPWDLPAAVPATAPQAMAHYFPPYPLALADTPAPTATFPGYYYQNYVPPSVTTGPEPHAAYGGLVRDWPLQAQMVSRSDPDRLRKDMEWEVEQAIAAGLSGFTIDMLSIRGYDGNPDTVGQWTRTKRMLDAIDAVNARLGTSFKAMLMPDCTTGATAWVTSNGAGSGTGVPDINASADALAAAIGQLLTHPCVHRIGGKLALAVFGPEKWPPATTGRTIEERVPFWQRFKQTMASTYGQADVLLWMCYVEAWTPLARTFDTIAYGHGRWGDRDYASAAGETFNNRGASAYCRATFGKPWMHFGGTPGDSRPKDTSIPGRYRTWESRGSLTLHNSWMAAIDGYTAGDMNQTPTWNDYSENSHIVPSRNLGYSLVDLTTYYTARYRTGVWPTIRRDGLFLFHRIMRTDTALASGTLQTKLAINGPNTPALEDAVEVVVCATAASEVQILRDGVVISTQSIAGAGMHRRTTGLPTGTGILSARMTRGGATVPNTTVTSTQTLQTAPTVDDYHYRGYSSLRQALNATPGAASFGNSPFGATPLGGTT